jgi:membrane-associated phospholipid phosphatase
MPDGAEILRFIQAWHAPWWDTMMLGFTELYGEPLFALVTLLYWFWPRSAARWLMTLVCANQWINYALKYSWNGPRPYGDGIRVVYEHPGPGLPSGHSQGTLVIFGGMALLWQRRWLWWLAAGMTLLMGYSRLYLGVHWPLDVLIGFAFGLVVLALFWFLRPARLRGPAPVAASAGAARAKPPLWQIGAALLVPAALLLLVHPWGLVPANDYNGQKDLVTILGLLAGFLAGSFAEERWVGFDATRGGLWQGVLKVLLGLALVGVVYGAGSLLGAGMTMRYVRYALLGATVTLLAPWAFCWFLRSKAGSRPEIRS